jgi:hypothetical protein
MSPQKKFELINGKAKNKTKNKKERKWFPSGNNYEKNTKKKKTTRAVCQDCTRNQRGPQKIHPYSLLRVSPTKLQMPNSRRCLCFVHPCGVKAIYSFCSTHFIGEVITFSCLLIFSFFFLFEPFWHFVLPVKITQPYNPNVYSWSILASDRCAFLVNEFLSLLVYILFRKCNKVKSILK